MDKVSVSATPTPEHSAAFSLPVDVDDNPFAQPPIGAELDGPRCNPFSGCEPGKIAELVASLIPDTPKLSPEEMAALEERRREGEARYEEARCGKLPEGMYRVLEQGGFIGWHYELEIDGECIALKAPFGDRQRAVELARAEIGRRHGEATAENAAFRFMWGGWL